MVDPFFQFIDYLITIFLLLLKVLVILPTLSKWMDINREGIHIHDVVLNICLGRNYLLLWVEHTFLHLILELFLIILVSKEGFFILALSWRVLICFAHFINASEYLPNILHNINTDPIICLRVRWTVHREYVFFILLINYVGLLVHIRIHDRRVV
jgi:hypothetical protein